MAIRLFVMALVVAAAQPVLAGPREDVRAAMDRCGVIQDDKVWLDCTYGAQQIMRARLGLPPAPEYQQRLVPPASAFYGPPPSYARPPMSQPGMAMESQPAPTAPRRGSFFQVLAGTAPPVAVSNLNAVAYDSQGAFIATLDNGQVWHQVNAAGKVRLRIGAKITVVPGAMWSYTLKVGDHAYKVERQS